MNGIVSREATMTITANTTRPVLDSYSLSFEAALIGGGNGFFTVLSKNYILYF
jgi:hypothetical protein